MRDIDSPLDGIRSPFGARGGADAYAILGYKPGLVFDFAEEYYRANSAATTFADALTHSRTSNATMVDSDGVLKWAPHNLLTWSEDFSNASWGTSGATIDPDVSATTAPDGTNTADKLVEASGTVAPIIFNSSASVLPGPGSAARGVYVKSAGDSRFLQMVMNDSIGGNRVLAVINPDTGQTAAASGVTASSTLVGDGWYFFSVSFASGATTNNAQIRLVDSLTTASTSYAADGTSGIYIWGAHLYRSDLGGMVNNPDRGDSYVPTTSTARYLPRRGHHIYNGTSWVNEGLLHESEARTNLLHTTDALVTQSLTVTAVPHTLHFTGTGTVTLLGASTAGPLVGTGTGENNRVSLTFTPTAASLTLTVTGTVANAQLEVGSTPSSYIPNLAASGSATRAAETLTVPAAKLPYSATAMSIQMQGRATGGALVPARWYLDANNYITQEIGASDFTFEQAASGTVDAVTGGSFTSGVNTSFNIASRHGSTFINGAVAGTALTANTTPTALPNLSATDMNLAYSGGPMVLKSVRMWAADITDAGLEAATV